jgi:hypothetical protein
VDEFLAWAVRQEQGNYELIDGVVRSVTTSTQRLFGLLPLPRISWSFFAA